MLIEALSSGMYTIFVERTRDTVDKLLTPELPVTFHERLVLFEPVKGYLKSRLGILWRLLSGP